MGLLGLIEARVSWGLSQVEDGSFIHPTQGTGASVTQPSWEQHGLVLLGGVRCSTVPFLLGRGGFA